MDGSRKVIIAKSSLPAGVRGKENQTLGFSIQRSAKGPHQVIRVELNSVASRVGLRANDYILKVNGLMVAGKSYSKLVDALHKALEFKSANFIQLDVIEPDLCPPQIKSRTASTGSLDFKDGMIKKHISIRFFLIIK